MKTSSERVLNRFLNRFAMSYTDAKALLGFKPSDSPTDDEIRKAQRTKIFTLGHDQPGGNTEEVVKVNVAADILLGKAKPSIPEYGTPSTTVVKNDEPIAPKEVSFDEAKAEAKVPLDVNWLFVTEKVYGGYSSDESRNSTTGYVIVGETEDKWVAVAIEFYERQDYYVGSRTQPQSIYSMNVVKTTKIVEPAKVYNLVTTAWEGMANLDKSFNSKIRILNTGFEFKDLKTKYPHSSRSTTIKNYLVDSGKMGEESLKSPRKFNIELKYLLKPIIDDVKYDYYKGIFSRIGGDEETLLVIVNGTEYQLSETSLRKLGNLKVGGKRFINQIYGQYVYSGTVKSLTRNGKGKEIMAWMVENLTDLPAQVKKALEASAVSK